MDDKEYDKEYDAFYKHGNTRVYIISPERTLGRKMTDEEKQKILDDASRVATRIYLKSKDIKE